MQKSSKVHPESFSIPISFYNPVKSQSKHPSSEKSSPIPLINSDRKVQVQPRSAGANFKVKHLANLPSISSFSIGCEIERDLNEVQSSHCNNLSSLSSLKRDFSRSSGLMSKLTSGSSRLSRPSQKLRSKTCRICLDSDVSNDFICPCACRGYQKWVHQECLKVWLVKSERFEQRKVFCEVCKEEFLMEFQYERFCAPCSEMSCRTWLPIVIALIMFSFIGCFVVQGYIDESVRGLVVFAVAVIFGIIGVVSFGIGIANAKAVCVEKRVCAWKVLSRG